MKFFSLCLLVSLAYGCKPAPTSSEAQRDVHLDTNSTASYYKERIKRFSNLFNAFESCETVLETDNKKSQVFDVFLILTQPLENQKMLIVTPFGAKTVPQDFRGNIGPYHIVASELGIGVRYDENTSSWSSDDEINDGIFQLLKELRSKQVKQYGSVFGERLRESLPFFLRRFKDEQEQLYNRRIDRLLGKAVYRGSSYWRIPRSELEWRLRSLQDAERAVTEIENGVKSGSIHYTSAYFELIHMSGFDRVSSEAELAEHIISRAHAIGVKHAFAKDAEVISAEKKFKQLFPRFANEVRHSLKEQIADLDPFVHPDRYFTAEEKELDKKLAADSAKFTHRIKVDLNNFFLEDAKKCLALVKNKPALEEFIRQAEAHKRELTKGAP